jgi:hypothetical protein
MLLSNVTADSGAAYADAMTAMADAAASASDAAAAAGAASAADGSTDGQEEEAAAAAAAAATAAAAAAAALCRLTIQERDERLMQVHCTLLPHTLLPHTLLPHTLLPHTLLSYTHTLLPHTHTLSSLPQLGQALLFGKRSLPQVLQGESINSLRKYFKVSLLIAYASTSR